MTKLHITTGSGKMANIFSINTPASTNPFCQMMAKTDAICKSCYATRNEAFRKNLVPAFQKNVDALLSSDFVPPSIPHKVIRFHSYGELHNPTHLANFIKIAFANPDTFFTLWTKRANYVQAYLRKGGVVPSNMNLIYSNPALNSERKTPPKGFDKVFNVHDKKGIEENGVTVNCGAKDCSSCMLCYTKNDVKVINEKKK